MVVSGPNGGGKSVLLTSIGWACELAQRGLPIPAKSIQLPPPPFRLAAVLGARDEVLRAGQEAMVGRTMEVLVDEIDLEAGIAVGHGAMDAPEVDPVVIAPADGSNVGERLQVQVAGVDAEFNLLGEGIFVED